MNPVLRGHSINLRHKYGDLPPLIKNKLKAIVRL